MNIVEKHKAIEFTTHVLSNKKLKDDERAEQLIVYFNSIILKYKRFETFDEIDAQSERNLRLLGQKSNAATSWCCLPCVKCLDLFKFMVALMFFIATGVGGIYILYYFGNRMF